MNLSRRGCGSPIKPAQRRGRPSLSADKLGQYFYIDDFAKEKTGSPTECTWLPHHVRFIIWYHLTTHLPHEAIAMAFSVTCGGEGDVPYMEGENVQTIVDVIKTRFALIKGEIAQRGDQYPRPTEDGWIPCDHGMCCGTLAEVSNDELTSVMRSAELRTRGAMEIADMATVLWDGNWEELLHCPRKHKTPAPAAALAAVRAGPQVRTPSLRKQKTAEVITVSDSSDSSWKMPTVAPGRRTQFAPILWRRCRIRESTGTTLVAEEVECRPLFSATRNVRTARYRRQVRCAEKGK